MSSHRPKVLLVDDRPENLTALDAVLEPLGLEHVHAHSGKEALKHLLKSDFAVILLDVQMPEMDGFETAQLIKQRSRTRDVPIIFVTAISRDTEHIYRGYSEGAVDYILKPYEPSVLRSKVHVFVQLYERSMALAESEERFRTAFANAPIGMALVALDGRFVQVNRALCDQLGYSDQELVATTWTAIQHPDDREKDRDLLRALVRGERVTYRVEKRCVRADASTTWIGFSVSVVKRSGGDPSHFVVQAEDITERRRAERERSERLREQARRAEAEALTQMVSKVQAVTDAAIAHVSVDALLPELVQRIAETLGTDTSAILLLDREDEHLVVRAVHGLPPTALGFRVPLGAGFAGTVAAGVRPVVIDDVASAHVLNPAIAESSARSLLGVPLLHEGRVIGVLHVGSKRAEAFDDDDVAVLQLVADRAALAIENAMLYDREHSIVETLQRSLLPERLPQLPGMVVAARYIAGGAGADVGGDWYDAVALPDGDVGLAMGDVVGHGIGAAALMGQLRNSLRAYAIDGGSPSEVVGRLDHMMQQLESGRMATLLYMRIAGNWSSVTYTSAGHLPALVVEPDGSTRYLEGGRSLPLGVFPQGEFEQGCTELEPGSMLVLYTDGLVERRGESLDVGMAALAAAAVAGPRSPEAMCDHLLKEMLGSTGAADDVGLLVLRTLPLRSEALSLDLPSDPKALMAMRHTLDRWLEEAGATSDEVADILLACHEAASNSIEHAYSFGDETFRLEVGMEDGSVRVRIADSGSWRKPEQTDRGRGLGMMKALMDSVDVKKGRDGTTVEMTRRLSQAPLEHGLATAVAGGDGSRKPRAKPKSR